MSSKYVHDVTWAFINANWSTTRLVDAMNSFETEEVSGGSLVEWTTLMFEESVETQVSVGAPRNNRWREEGTVTLIAFVPSGTGTDRALTLAEDLRTLIREQQLSAGVGQPTVVFRGVMPPDTAMPSTVGASSGNWFGYAVSATYYCDFCHSTT